MDSSLILFASQDKTVGETVGSLDGDFEGDSVGVLVGVLVGDFEGTLVGDLVGDMVGDFDGTLVGVLLGVLLGVIDGDFVVLWHEVKSSDTTSVLHVSLKNLTATAVPFVSRSDSLAEDKRHKHLLGSAGSVPQYLLIITTLSMMNGAESSTSHHEIRSVVRVCEKVPLFPSMALDAALVFKVEDCLATPDNATFEPPAKT